MRVKKYIIERSNYPEGEKTHILFLHSSTQHGENFQGIFKGTHKECLEKKHKLEKRLKKNGKTNTRNKITRLSKRK